MNTADKIEFIKIKTFSMLDRGALRDRMAMNEILRPLATPFGCWKRRTKEQEFLIKGWQ